MDYDSLTHKQKSAIASLPMDEETRLIIFGMGRREENRIITGINDIWRPYRQGGPGPSLDESLQKLKTTVGASVLGGAAGTFFAARRIQDQFNFVTMPSFNITKRAVGGYQQAVADMLRTQTEISFKYGNMLANFLSVGYTVLRNMGTIERIGGAIRDVVTAAKVGARARETQELAASVAAAPETAGTSLIAGLALAVVDIATTVALQHIGQYVGGRITSGYAHSRARQIFASKLLDKQRIVNDFNAYASSFVGYSQFNGNNGYALMDTMRNQSMFGMPLSRLGYDYTQLEPLIAYISHNARVKNMSDLQSYVSNSAIMAGLYGANPQATAQIYSQLSLIGPRQKAIQESTREFEKFFTAVSGGGKPQVAQIRLVGELTAFSKDYGYAVKMNASAPQNLANIQNFVAKDNQFKSMLTTQPTQTMVKGLDEVLGQGAIMTNARANELLAIGHISPAAALRGVTGNSDTFNKVLGALAIKLGITKESFTPGTATLNEGMLKNYYMYMHYGLGVNNSTQQVLMRALHLYVNGARATEVYNTYINGVNQTTASYYLDPNFFMSSWTQKFAQGNIDLSKQIMKHAQLLGQVNDMIVNAFEKDAPRFVSMVGQFGITIAKTLHEEQASTKPHSLSQTIADYKQIINNLPKTMSTPLVPLGPVVHTGIQKASQLMQALPFGVAQKVGKPFLEKVQEISDRLGINPRYLLAAMQVESGLSPSQKNMMGSGATGLIQFMPDTASKLGTTIKALSQMSPIEQLTYVEKYMSQYSKLFHEGYDNIGDVYAAIFWPAAIGKPMSWIIARAGSKVYAQNYTLDVGNKGYITKQDLVYRVMLGYNGLFSNKALNTATSINKYDLLTTEAQKLDTKYHMQKAEHYLYINTQANFVSHSALANAVGTKIQEIVNGR